jgi:hypothetical protein
MDINSTQSELITRGIQLAIEDMLATAHDRVLSKEARNIIKQDAKDLNEIRRVINNKEFSIVLKE